MLIMNSCSSQKYQFVIQAINQHQPKMIIITLYMHPMAQRMLSWKPKTLICPMTNVHWFNREKLQTRDKIIKIYFFFILNFVFLFISSIRMNIIMRSVQFFFSSSLTHRIYTYTYTYAFRKVLHSRHKHIL